MSSPITYIKEDPHNNNAQVSFEEHPKEEYKPAAPQTTNDDRDSTRTTLEADFYNQRGIRNDHDSRSSDDDDDDDESRHIYRNHVTKEDPFDPPPSDEHEIVFNPDESIPTNLGREDPPGCYPEQPRLHKALIEGKWHEAYSFLLDPVFVLPKMDGYPKVEEVGFVDSFGSLPLHIAVGLAPEVRAPFKVVSLLLEKGPAYAKERHVLSQELPLHMACRPLIRPEVVNSQSWPRLKIEPASDLETIIQIIHEQYPEAVWAKTGDDTSFPLHILLEHQPPLSLVKRFLATKGGASSLLSFKDDDQRIPLHVAIEHHASADVIEQLLDFRSARTSRMKHGDTPLHVAAFHGCTLQVLQALLAEPGAIAMPCHKAAKGENFDGSNTPLHVLFHPNLKPRWTAPLDTTLAPRRDHTIVAAPLNCLHPSDMFRYLLKTHAEATEGGAAAKKRRTNLVGNRNYVPEHLKRARALLSKKNQAGYTVITQADNLSRSCIANGRRVPAELLEVLEQMREITSGSPLYKEWPSVFQH